MPKHVSHELLLAAITPEIRAKRGKAAGKTMLGRPQRIETPVGAKTDNQFAKTWAFHNTAKGKVLSGKNLNQLIRDHLDWFDPDDVVFNGPNCRASICLRTLVAKSEKRTRNSWKGWFAGLPVQFHP